MTSQKIVDRATAREKVESWVKEGLEVVFTNGCFDLLHLGHVDYLEKAASKGDKLVVGLNTDASVRAIKGAERPITDETSRSRILAALAFVDLVVLFNDDTPKNLIETIRPSILVKGSDYLAENIVGADFVISTGGRVETIDLVRGYSTSTIIKKIKGE